MSACPLCKHELEGPRGISVDVASGIALIGDVSVRLTTHEAAIFEGIIHCHPRPANKDFLMSWAYPPYGMPPDMKIIDVYICKIRKKMAQKNVNPIRTVWGRGYCLDCPPQPIPYGVSDLRTRYVGKWPEVRPEEFE